MVFSRPLTDEEWTAFTKRVDAECWDNQIENWDACKMEMLMKDVCPGIEVVLFER